MFTAAGRVISSLSAATIGIARTQADKASSQPGAGAAELQTLRLRIRRHAGACPPPAQRTAIGEFPTQAKIGLEWATRPNSGNGSHYGVFFISKLCPKAVTMTFDTLPFSSFWKLSVTSLDRMKKSVFDSG